MSNGGTVDELAAQAAALDGALAIHQAVVASTPAGGVMAEPADFNSSYSRRTGPACERANVQVSDVVQHPVRSDLTIRDHR